MTVLSGFSRETVNGAFLQVRVNSYFEERLAQKTNAISGSFGAKVNAINLRADRFRDLRADLLEDDRKISNVINRIKVIRRGLDNLLSTVTKANQDEEADTNATGYQSAFDSIVGGLRRSAESASDSPNLIGRIGTQKLTYPTNISGASQSVQGIYLGTDYYITDADGKRWQPDRAAKLLRQYDDYPETPSTKVANLATGVRLDSLVDNTLSFTTGPDTGSPETFAGATLNHEGIRVLDAWLYDGLATADGRARALADVEAAKDAIDLELSRYEIVRTTIGYYGRKAEIQVDGYNGETDTLLIQQAQAIGEAQADLQRQLQATNSNLAQSFALKAEYGRIFQSFITSRNNPLISALIDINA